MGIFRTTNPASFDDVDGIIINESAPVANVRGTPVNIACLVGECERGPFTLTEVGSIGEFHELFGKNDSYGVNVSLKNKKFGRLKVIRVSGGSNVVAAHTFVSAGSADIITFSALYKGAYGNAIKVTIATGTTSGKKYTITDSSAGAVLPDEVYDNLAITAITSSTFANSKLVSCTVVATSAEPANITATALSSGSDGTVADADYLTAIAKTEVEASCNILFLDSYNATRNGYLKTTAALMQDKMVIICGGSGDSVATAVADAASYRDSDGRIIYAYPWVYTTVSAVSTLVNPASFYAALLSQIAPNVDPAYAANTQYLPGITDLALNPTRANYISLVAAGISAFENDADIGFKIKSGVVTQISDSSKIMVFRRRMADYLTYSVAKFLKNYQNAPNSKANRTAVKAAMLAFIQAQELAGVLPRDSDVTSGLSKLVDTESLNTNTTIALGFFKILWKQRIFSSMRYIVIQAEIGESVVVTEGEAS